MQVDATFDGGALHVPVERRDDVNFVAASREPGGDLLDEWRGCLAGVFGI
jgi:hypothetical protein